jgi:hypothetical protein
MHLEKQPLLGNKYITGNNAVTAGSGVFCAVRANAVYNEYQLPLHLYGRKSQGTRTRERLRWQGLAAHTKDRPVLSSERAPRGNKNVSVRQK